MTQQQFQQRYTYNPTTDKLGEGGFGSVFKGYDTYLDRTVAIKIAKVNPEYETIRLRKEVDMVAKLPAHPNIAYYEECYTFTQMDGEYDFGIMQCYEEGNLLQLMRRGNGGNDDRRDGARPVSTITTEQKQKILTQILNGLSFLHQHGIIHRDLKPQNILLVNRNGEYIPKITDFGISKQLDINKSSVFSNSLAGAGTLAYASPEQLGGRHIRKNTDLWSFGVIAYQLFTGEQPFTSAGHGGTQSGLTELFRQINSGVLPDKINEIEGTWQRVIRACLVADAGKRVKSCGEVGEILAGGRHCRDAARHVSTEGTTDKTKIELPNDDKTIVAPATVAQSDDTIVAKRPIITLQPETTIDPRHAFHQQKPKLPQGNIVSNNKGCFIGLFVILSFLVFILWLLTN